MRPQRATAPVTEAEHGLTRGVTTRYRSLEQYPPFSSVATQITTVAGFTSGDDTISTDLLENFFIDGLAGDDNITLEEAASNFTLKGATGDDLIKPDSDVSATSLLKGGAGDDTVQQMGAIAGSSVYGGKGADSLYFAAP